MNINLEAKAATLTGQSAFEAEIAALIVSSLHLEISADEIEPEAPLFIDGLGLDSIDALELALAISRNYGLELKSDDARTRSIFANLRSLASNVGRDRTK